MSIASDTLEQLEKINARLDLIEDTQRQYTMLFVALRQMMEQLAPLAEQFAPMIQMVAPLLNGVINFDLAGSIIPSDITAVKFMGALANGSAN